MPKREANPSSPTRRPLLSHADDQRMISRIILTALYMLPVRYCLFSILRSDLESAGKANNKRTRSSCVIVEGGSASHQHGPRNFHIHGYIERPSRETTWPLESTVQCCPGSMVDGCKKSRPIMGIDEVAVIGSFLTWRVQFGVYFMGLHRSQVGLPLQHLLLLGLV